MSGRGAPSKGEAGMYDGECTRATSLILLKGVIDVMFLGRKLSHVQMVRLACKRKFKRQMDQDIVDSEPSHAFQRSEQTLVARGALHRAHQVEASQHVAKCDAGRLYETGEGSSAGAIDEGVVLEILSKRSIPQLKLTFLCYTQIYGHSDSELKWRSNREFEDALRMVVKWVVNPSQYYAELLYASMKENPTTDRGRKEATWMMATRAGIDLDDVQEKTGDGAEGHDPPEHQI